MESPKSVEQSSSLVNYNDFRDYRDNEDNESFLRNILIKFFTDFVKIVVKLVIHIFG